MIFISNKVEHLVQICKKIDEQNDKQLNPAEFLKYMLMGIQNKHTLVLVSFPNDDENKKINGCAVITIINSNEETFLWIDYTWIDKTAKTLGKKFLETIENITKEMDINIIKGRTIRNCEAIEKKYGFIKDYTVIKKDLKEA